jgi:hypothetical protein
LEAKGDIKRKPLGDTVGVPCLMLSPFHWGPLHLIQILGRPEQLNALVGHMMVDLMTQILRCSGPQMFLFYFALNKNGCIPLGGMKTEPVRWAVRMYQVSM